MSSAQQQYQGIQTHATQREEAQQVQHFGHHAVHSPFIQSYPQSRDTGVADHPGLQTHSTHGPSETSYDTDSLHTPPPPTRKHAVASGDSVQAKQEKNSKGHWRWEITNAVLSITCVIAISAILFKIDGRLLSSWTMIISPNAVISILSTASKASMVMAVAASLSQLKWLHYEKSWSVEHLQIFDDASRGPWGSFVFFLLARRVSLFAYIGCVVTVATLALDPFAQQIISFDTRSASVPGGISSILRSNIYDYGGKGLTPVYMNELYLISSSTRDGKLQAAAISGLYNLTSPLAPPFICQGNNCTYPTFTSLGMCGQCTDVTTITSKICDQTSPVSQTCNYTTPNGLELQAYASGDDYHGFRYTHINTTYSTENVLCANGENSCLAYENQGSIGNADYIMLLNLTIIRFDTGFEVTNSWDARDTSWRDTLQAFQCTQELCATAYSNWTSVNGTVIPGTLRQSGLNGSLAGSSPLDATVVYTTLDQDFPGNQTLVLNLYDRLNFAQVLQKVSYDAAPYTPDPSQSNLFLDALYNSENITATMDNIATSVSYQMLSGPNATVVDGEVYAEQTYIHVRWVWLSLNVALVIVAALFLAAVVFASSKTRQPVWKSSLAPLLSEHVQMLRDIR